MRAKAIKNEALTVEWRKLDSIRPYPKNARKIGQRAIDAVAKSIKEFGWRQPIVVDKEGVIVIGHVRRLAAIQLALLEVPVHVADLPAAKIRALRLMDNRSHDEAQWDPEILTAEMLELRALDLDLSMTGFNSRELDALLRVDSSDEDDVPPVPEAVVTKPGDLWLMGEHRLLCGDALDDWSADVMLTDPPYGVGVNYGAFEDTRENVSALIPRIMKAAARCGVALLTPGVPCMWMYPQPSWLLCWLHPAPSGGCPWGFAGVNPILAYGDDPYLKAGLGRRPDSIVMATDREGVEGHPTPKPMKVWKWLNVKTEIERWWYGVLLFYLFSGTLKDVVRWLS